MARFEYAYTHNNGADHTHAPQNKGILWSNCARTKSTHTRKHTWSSSPLARAISKQKNRRHRVIMMIRIAINEFALALEHTRTHFKCVFIQSGLIVSSYVLRGTSRLCCTCAVWYKSNNPLNQRAYITLSHPTGKVAVVPSCVCCENKHCHPFVRGHNRNNEPDSSAVANVVACVSE